MEIYTNFADALMMVGNMPEYFISMCNVSKKKEIDLKLVSRIRNGNIEGVISICEDGYDINKPFSEDVGLGLTPLHLASFFSVPKICEYLISKVSNVNFRMNTVMASALHFSVISPEPKIDRIFQTIEVLIKKGADYRLIDMHGHNFFEFLDRIEEVRKSDDETTRIFFKDTLRSELHKLFVDEGIGYIHFGMKCCRCLIFPIIGTRTEVGGKDFCLRCWQKVSSRYSGETIITYSQSTNEEEEEGEEMADPTEIVDILFESADKLIQEEENYEKALGIYNKVVSLNPNYPQANVRKGLCLIVLGKTVEGLLLLNRDKSERKDFSFYLGLCLQSQIEEKLDDAINFCTNSISVVNQNRKKNKDFLNLLYRKRGALYLQKDNFKKSYDDLSTAILLNPSDCWSFYQRSIVQLMLMEFEKSAVDMFLFLQFFVFKRILIEYDDMEGEITRRMITDYDYCGYLSANDNSISHPIEEINLFLNLVMKNSNKRQVLLDMSILGDLLEGKDGESHDEFLRKSSKDWKMILKCLVWNIIKKSTRENILQHIWFRMIHKISKKGDEIIKCKEFAENNGVGNCSGIVGIEELKNKMIQYDGFLKKERNQINAEMMMFSSSQFENTFEDYNNIENFFKSFTPPLILEYSTTVKKDDCILILSKDKDINNDKEMVLKAVIQNPENFKHANEEMKNNREIAFHAISNGISLEYLPNRLRKDRDFIINVLHDVLKGKNNLQKPFDVLKYVEEEFRSDREIVLLAVRASGSNLEFASQELRGDIEISLASTSKETNFRYTNGFQFVSDELKNNKEFIIKIVSFISPRDISDQLMRDRSFVLKAISVNPFVVACIGNELGHDIPFLVEAIRTNCNCYDYIDEELFYNNVILLCEAIKARMNIDHENVSNRIRIGDAIDQISPISVHERETRKLSRHALMLDPSVPELYYIISRLYMEHDPARALDWASRYIFLTSSSYSEDLNKKIKEVIDSVQHGYMLLRRKDIFEKKNYYNARFLKNVSDYESVYRFKKDSRKDEDIEKKEIENIRNLVQQKKSTEDFEFFEFLGKGSYGCVFLCKIKEEEKQDINGVIVLKTFRHARSMSKKKTKESVDKDSLMLSLPYHRNVSTVYSRVYSSKIEKKYIDGFSLSTVQRVWGDGRKKKSYESGFILMKYYQKDLKSFINQKINSNVYGRCYHLGDLELCYIIQGIIRGVKHLHDNFIVHRDLHPKNIFIDDFTSRVYIADFGCALDLRDNPTGFKVQKDSKIMFSFRYSSEMSFNEGGAPKYLPPEIKDFNRNGDEEYINYEKCDLFAIGMNVLFLIDGNRKCLEKIKKVSGPYMPNDCKFENDEKVKTFIEGLLKKEVQSRFGMNEAFEKFEKIVQEYEKNTF